MIEKFYKIISQIDDYDDKNSNWCPLDVSQLTLFCNLFNISETEIKKNVNLSKIDFIWIFNHPIINAEYDNSKFNHLPICFISDNLNKNFHINNIGGSVFIIKNLFFIINDTDLDVYYISNENIMNKLKLLITV